MRALSWDGERATVEEREDPKATPGDGMAVVLVDLAGVCNTDLEIVKGYMGSFRGILGHEFVGEVVQGPEDWSGQRVVGEINFACGECVYCDSGLKRHCPERRVMGIHKADGAFAELVRVPVSNLHRVPDEVSDAAAVFVEPLAAAFQILEQVQVTEGDRCIVLGDGKLGLLVAQVLHRAGREVLCIGKHAEKLAIVDRRGIETATLEAWNRAPADVVVEATGSLQGLELAMAATRPRGTLVLKSTVADSHSMNLSPLVVNEINVVGSRCGPFPPALMALASQSIDVEGLISERVPLSKATEGLRRAESAGALKVLFECG
ncbi:MAG: alcohol dehydrogenase catalytic domain-containing protein [Proteobacteria bacterium]|nr:alcohol dehydrogenase catalytic domain-containing protein [Pseudomonadota bacterium]